MQSVSVSNPVVARAQCTSQSAKTSSTMCGLPARQARKSVVYTSAKMSDGISQKASKAAVLALTIPALLTGMPAFAKDMSLKDMMETPAAEAPAAEDSDEAKAARKAAAKALQNEIQQDAQQKAKKPVAVKEVKNFGGSKEVKEASGGFSLPKFGGDKKAPAAKAEKAVKAPGVKGPRVTGTGESVYAQPLLIGMVGLFSPLLLVAAYQVSTLVKVVVRSTSD